MDVERELVKHLMADEKLKRIIGHRLFPLAIPQHEDVPAIVYQRISTPRTLGLTEEGASNPRFQFSAYAEDYAEVRQMAMYLKESLDYFRGKIAVLQADARENFEHETGRYRADVDFFAMY